MSRKTDSTSEPTAETFDYVVVGAGSAGCAVANRLSADGTHRVLLLEAGPTDRNPAIHVPAAFSRLFRSPLDWNYDTEPQPALDGRTIYWPRGKVLGGSSSLNAMMWVRGFAADYDHWAELAGDQWSFESLLPYFRRVERVVATSDAAHDPEHGTDGAIDIQPQRHVRSHTGEFLKAVTEAGHRVVDANTRQPDGFSQTMVTQRRGARASTAVGYLRPARSRANLAVRTGAQVTRVVLQRVEGVVEAVGVEALIDGTRRVINARREVVLSGGTVNTPQLLMLSGIGDSGQLAPLGIDTVVHAPEVGKNMRDHLISLLGVPAAGGTLFGATKIPEVLRYLVQRRGMLTSNVAEAYGFVRTRSELALPDVEILFAPALYVGEGLVPVPAEGVGMGAILLQPKSRGEVRLASADPLAKAIIDPCYLSDPDGDDRRTLLAGLAACEDILATPTMRSMTGGAFYAPENGERMSREQRDLESVRSLSHTIYHPTSTVRMGSDAAAPVDPELRVRGVRRLRVADASVMPEIIRGHTNAPAIVIGEKAAELILRSA